MTVAGGAGSIFWAMYHLTTTWKAKRPVGRDEIIAALLNVAAGIVCGVLSAAFLGPSVVAFIPIKAFQDPWVVGFCFGMGSFEAAPLIYKRGGDWLRAFKPNASKGEGE